MNSGDPFVDEFYNRIYCMNGIQTSYSKSFYMVGGGYRGGSIQFNPEETKFWDNLEYCLRKEFDKKLEKEKLEVQELKERVSILEKALADALDALAQK